MSLLSLYPEVASASILSAVTDFFSGRSSNSAQVIKVEDLNSQNVPLLQSFTNFDPSAARGGSDLVVVDEEALMSEDGPSGTQADISDTMNTGQISKYTVRKGDTLESVAKMFGVSKNTIVWANSISGSLKEGQALLILPVSGTIHTVVKGDTLKGIAKKYKADVGEIVAFNGIDQDAGLAVGDIIVIPDGEGTSTNAGSTKSTTKSTSGKGTTKYLGGSGPDLSGYYIRPLAGGIKTQGLHGWNAVDIGTPVGTTIMASAAGEVILSRSSGWNGGYGRYIVISHPNGTQTVYGHLSKNYVSEGDHVSQGQAIGLSGNTGNSTGPHLHFEVRGARNPFQ